MAEKIDDIYNNPVPEANATAYGTGIGNVRVFIDPKTNRVQNEGFENAPGVMIVPDGSKVGFLIDGVNDDGTYKSTTVDLTQNAAGGAPAGGITGGGTVAGTSQGNSPSVESMYANGLRRFKGNRNALTQEQVNQLESQKKNVHDAYDASARNAYANYMMNNKNLNEQLIRAGLSESGMTESSQIASNAAYGAELTQNEVGRNATINDIDMQISGVKQQGAQDIMNAEQTYNLNMIGYKQSQEQLNQQRAWAQEDSNKAYALQMIASGVITPEYAAAAGMTVDEATTYYHNTSGFVNQKRNELSVFAGTDYVPSDEELAQANWTREQWDSLNKAATPTKVVSGGGNSVKTDYTYGAMLSEIQNSSDPMGTYTQLMPYMSESQVEKLRTEAEDAATNNTETIVDKLNKEISDKYGNSYKAVEVVGGEYKVSPQCVDFVIIRVYGDKTLTDQQRESLLYDKFGITEEQVEAVLRDPHYR